MKIGDRVKSEYWNLEGVVQEIRPCTGGPMCGDESLTLDVEGSGVRSYFHTTKFEVIEKVAK